MRGSYRARPGAAGLLLVAGGAYALWLLEFVLPTGLDPVRSFVSEHYPVFQPYQQLFRAGDLIAGAAYVAAAYLLRRRLPPARCAVALRRSLVVFGAGTVLDAVFVPDCVSTVDPVCERLEFTGQVSWQHLVHLGSSVVTQLAVVVIAFATLRLAGRYGSQGDRRLVRVLFTIWAVAGLACVAAYPFGWPGLPQRIQLLVMSAATAAGAIRCFHRHHTPPPRSGSRPPALVGTVRRAAPGTGPVSQLPAAASSGSSGRATQAPRPPKRRTHRSDGVPAGVAAPRRDGVAPAGGLAAERHEHFSGARFDERRDPAGFVDDRDEGRGFAAPPAGEVPSGRHREPQGLRRDVAVEPPGEGAAAPPPVDDRCLGHHRGDGRVVGEHMAAAERGAPERDPLRIDPGAGCGRRPRRRGSSSRCSRTSITCRGLRTAPDARQFRASTGPRHTVPRRPGTTPRAAS
ncbi:DUF998 domain-containing protein [Amycolatopsis sp. NPDC004747]